MEAPAFGRQAVPMAGSSLYEKFFLKAIGKALENFFDVRLKDVGQAATVNLDLFFIEIV